MCQRCSPLTSRLSLPVTRSVVLPKKGDLSPEEGVGLGRTVEETEVDRRDGPEESQLSPDRSGNRSSTFRFVRSGCKGPTRGRASSLLFQVTDSPDSPPTTSPLSSLLDDPSLPDRPRVYDPEDPSCREHPT